MSFLLLRSRAVLIACVIGLLCSCQGEESSENLFEADLNELDTEVVGENTDVDAGGPSESDTNPNPSAGEQTEPSVSVSRIIDHSDIQLSSIPTSDLVAAKSSLHIVYQHTSHGSQLITGMNALQAFPPYNALYTWNDAGDGSGIDLDDRGIPASVADLSQGDSVNAEGDTHWVIGTRELLDDPANGHVNVVMWSWCSINGHDAQRYIDNMEKLIVEYPDVVFVFMTGHAEGLGEDLSVNTVHYNNELIRAHVRAHNRWLFDFADIESFDPGGNYYWDMSMRDNLHYDDGNWAVEWIAANPNHDFSLLTLGEGVDNYAGTHGCAHSDSPREANLNCVLKGAAAWSLFARIASELH